MVKCTVTCLPLCVASPATPPRAPVTFVSSGGQVSTSQCCSTSGLEKNAMIRSAQRVVVLADSSKIGHESTVRFGDLDQVDVLITDDGLGSDDRATLEAHDIEVVVA